MAILYGLSPQTMAEVAQKLRDRLRGQRFVIVKQKTLGDEPQTPEIFGPMMLLTPTSIHAIPGQDIAGVSRILVVAQSRRTMESTRIPVYETMIPVIAETRYSFPRADRAEFIYREGEITQVHLTFQVVLTGDADTAPSEEESHV